VALMPSQCIVLLDVGHGNCAIVRDNANIAVIDTGRGSCLLEFLAEQQIAKIDTVLISHADQDHISGLIALLASGTVQIGSVRLNPDALKTSKIWDDLLYELDQRQSQGDTEFIPTLTSADTGHLNCGDIHLEVIGPSPYLAAKGPGSADREGRKLTTNSVSVVVRVVWQDNPVILLSGDMDDLALNDISAHGMVMTAPILVWPHHGGRVGAMDATDFATRLCAAVQPRSVVFSIGRDSGYQTPRPEIVSVIKAMLEGVRISCTQLSNACAVNLPGPDPNHLTPLFAKGRDTKRCCAGTLLVDLNMALDLRPDYARHQAFIATHAPTALCAVRSRTEQEPR
jgi:beta-lactamase superfamily II metal-dependent hydrolase